VRTQAELVMLSIQSQWPRHRGPFNPTWDWPQFSSCLSQNRRWHLPCDGVAATCFTYHFYTIAKENKSLPWHQVVAQARQKLREMTTSDLKTLADKLNLNVQEDECCFSVEHYKWQTVSDYPFEGHVFWTGFTVLGRVARKK